jgi:uncharacterized protein (TIGR03000 family)
MRRAVTLAFLMVLTPASLAAQPPRPPESKPIFFEVRVPAEAVLEIEGIKTRTTGETRQFKTPEIPLGRRYTYTIKVTFEGKTTTHQLLLTHTGPNVLDLRRELQAGRPAPAGTALFTVVAPRDMILKPGDAAPLSVKIKREGHTGPVDVVFQGLPPGVKISDATIAAGKDEQSALAVATKDARPGVSVVDVIAKAGRAQKLASFKLTVAAAAPTPSAENTKKPADQPKPPPADLPNDPPPVPPGTKKPEEKPKPPPPDLPDDPPPRPPMDTKKPPEKK